MIVLNSGRRLEDNNKRGVRLGSGSWKGHHAKLTKIGGGEVRWVGKSYRIRRKFFNECGGVALEG